MKKWLVRIAIGVVPLFALAQVVPYGRDHSSPSRRAEPRWDSPRTRQLAVAACFDCHSNETKWPWYSNVAPSSWLLQRDVDEGRKALNFSESGRAHEEGDDVAEVIDSGEMPPWYYRLMHPDARLSSSERAALVDGLANTLGGSGESGGDH